MKLRRQKRKKNEKKVIYDYLKSNKKIKKTKNRKNDKSK